jgi:UDP-N-acetylmuramoyl-L-alanyl-D-glutamate--2,6-diaminopimelate ligase
MQLIGVTGTNGKTTVATLTYQVLKKLGIRASLLGTVAKYIGDETRDSRLTTSDPIELARDMRRMVEAGSSHLVMEVSSHALDQGRTDGLNFGIGAFTNLSHDHLDYHSSLEEYAHSKKRLFDGLNTQAHAIVNADDEQAEFIAADCQARIVKFGFNKAVETPCRLLSNTSRGIVLEVDGTQINSPLVGSFNAYNVAEAFLICRALGLDPDDIARALSEATGAIGRMERVQLDHDTDVPLVLVDYAHTPDALENVLRTLASLKSEGQQLHVIFGCGGNRDKSKRPKMAAVSEMYADRVTVTSDNPRDEDPGAIIEDTMKGFRYPDRVTRTTDRRKAIRETIADADTSTIVLIAGKGHETYQEIRGVRHHFDDREEALAALKRFASNAKTGGGA